MLMERFASLSQMVERQAAQTPSAVAVVQGARALTYFELNSLANGLANHLISFYGVQSGSLVGLLLERSELAIVAMLAVLKAGAAYVPIDARHPSSVVDELLGSIGISILISDAASVSRAVRYRGALCILDAEMAEIRTSGRPATTTGTGDLAYVIFTSGSTGKAKAVGIEHGAILNTLLWRNEYYGFGPSDRTLQFAPYAFDSSVVDIFCGLSTGGTLVIPVEAQRLDVRFICSLLSSAAITRLLLTPSYYELLLPHIEASSALRSITLAGECVHLPLVHRHFAKLPLVKLVNEYGPTEAAVCATAGQLNPGAQAVSIGRPIAHCEVHLLDESLRPVPRGDVGEIYIAGAGLAREYLNDPRATHAAFVAGPSGSNIRRMYKTGDLGRVIGDDELEFMGRCDDQIKVRGHRIELGHIDEKARQYSGVIGAAAVCKKHRSGEQYIALYCTSTESVSSAGILRWLSETLPAYMVPSVVQFLPSLPLNGNNKIDREKLRRVEDFNSEPAAATVYPTGLEVEVAEICCTVLGMQGIAPNESLFTATPISSLGMMRLAAAIQERLEPNIRLEDLYMHPSIRTLAGRIESMRRDLPSDGRGGEPGSSPRNDA